MNCDTILEENFLGQISSDKWPELRDKFLINWPTNILGYYTIDNFIRWIQKQPDIKHLQLYCLNGDWSDGTFVAIDRYQLFVNTLDPSNQRLTTLLSLLDWTRGFKVSTHYERHRSAVHEIIDKKQLSKEYDSLTCLYYLPKAEALQLNYELPNGIRLGSLSESDAVDADGVWPNRHTGSTYFLKRLANWNPNVGVYNTDNDELVAWSFRLQAGVVGALQTKEKYLKRGYGLLALKAISQQIAKLGHDLSACVNPDNIPSRKMFEKAGYKHIDNAYWLRTYPTSPFEWTDE